MDELVTLTAQLQPYGHFQVAYDGRILGDDRSYPTKLECEREIDRRIAVDARDAIRYERPVMYQRSK